MIDNNDTGEMVGLAKKNPGQLELSQKIGIAVYAVSYALPAVHSAGEQRPILGITCAYEAFFIPPSFLLSKTTPITAGDALICLLELGGIANVLLLIFLLVRRTRTLGSALTIAAFVLLASAELYLFGVRPLVGYFVWVLGIALILVSRTNRRSFDSAQDDTSSVDTD